MTLQTQAAPYLGYQTNWLYDDAAGDFVPTVGNAPIDLVRGHGRLTAFPIGSATAVPARALVNQLLPPGILFVQGTPGVELNTFTTRQAINAAALLPGFAQQSFGGAYVANTIPAGALNLVGRTIRVRGGGTWGVTGTPNFTLDISLGANVLATTTAFATSAVTSPQNFSFDCECTVTTAGASGVINSEGSFSGNITALTAFPAAFANSVPGTGLTIDLTAAYVLSVGATWSVSSASNRIRLFNLTVETLY